MLARLFPRNSRRLPHVAAIDLKLLDKRTAERYIARGLLDEKEWEKHLKSLEDSEQKGAAVETSMAGDEEFEDDDEQDEDDEEQA